jgi:hypothetical protein
VRLSRLRSVASDGNGRAARHLTRRAPCASQSEYAWPGCAIGSGPGAAHLGSSSSWTACTARWRGADKGALWRRRALQQPGYTTATTPRAADRQADARPAIRQLVAHPYSWAPPGPDKVIPIGLAPCVFASDAAPGNRSESRRSRRPEASMTPRAFARASLACMASMATTALCEFGTVPSGQAHGCLSPAVVTSSPPSEFPTTALDASNGRIPALRSGARKRQESTFSGHTGLRRWTRIRARSGPFASPTLIRKRPSNPASCSRR